MYVQRFGIEKKNYFLQALYSPKSCARHESVYKIMKLYQIGDTSKFTSNALFKTAKQAEQYIKEIVTNDVKQGYKNIWENDFIIWELNTEWMMRTEYKTIEIEKIKNSL